MRPDVALGVGCMAAAARGEAGIYLLIASGFRSDAEQDRRFMSSKTLPGGRADRRRGARAAPVSQSPR